MSEEKKQKKNWKSLFFSIEFYELERKIKDNQIRTIEIK